MGIAGHIQPGEGLKYHKILKYVQEFWGDYPLERRMNVVRKTTVGRRKN